MSTCFDAPEYNNQSGGHTMLSTAIKRSPRPRPFTIIDNDILNNLIGRVSPQSITLYILLRSYSDNNYKPCYPSVKLLASRMACSESSINRYLNELEEVQVILIKKGKYNKNIYHFNTGYIEPAAPAKIENNNRFAKIVEGDNHFINEYTEPAKVEDSTFKFEGTINKNLNNQNNKTTPEHVEPEELVADPESKEPNKLDHVSNNKIKTNELDHKNNVGVVIDYLTAKNYVKWYVKQGGRVINPIGLTKWIVSNPDSIDLTDYLKHIQKEQGRKELKNRTAPVITHKDEWIAPDTNSICIVKDMITQWRIDNRLSDICNNDVRS